MLINQNFEINEKGRDFVVGDIHGCYDQLQEQLKSINFDGQVDRLFSVGDLIDRGPDNLKCLQLINEPWFYAVRGNHEDFMISVLVYQDISQMDLWFYNGGNWLDKYKDDKEGLTQICELAVKFDKECPLAITLKTKHGTIGICHAEPPTNDWQDILNENLHPEDIQRMLWDRYMIQMGDIIPDTKNIDLTIHGHTPVKEIETAANAMFIDTGSFLKHHEVSDEYKGVQIIRIDNILEKI